MSADLTLFINDNKYLLVGLLLIFLTAALIYGNELYNRRGGRG